MELIQEVASFVRRTLQNAERAAQEIAEHVVHTMGMKEMSQLKLLKEDDLSHIQGISVFDLRALLASIKAEPDKENLGCSGNVQHDDRRRPLIQRQNIQREKEWDFAIDWHDLYNIDNSLKKNLKKGKKLKKAQTKEVIRRIVLQVKKNVHHAKRSIFRQIVRDMKDKYPVSFSSELAGGKINRGSLCGKMQSKYDESKRPSRKTEREEEAPAIKAAYGCKRWRATSLPDGETQESLVQRQREMEEYFEQTRPSAYDQEYIKFNMTLTFGLQRKDINMQAEQLEKARKQLQKSKRKGAQLATQEENVDDIQLTTTESIRDRWPFLFLPQGMIAHFEQLTQIKLSDTMAAFFNEGAAAKILNFMRETNKGKKKKIIKRMEKESNNLPEHNAELIAILQLVMRRFNEPEDALWLMVDEHAREEDLPQLARIPKTPRIIIAGSYILNPKEIYYAMDGNVLGTANNLMEGICLLFSAYYVFNLEYEATGQITLEFIQRCIVLLNPPKGNKRPRREKGGHFSSRQVHATLSSFTDKFDEFMADKESSNSSNEDDI